MNDSDLIARLESLKATMISVATGGPRIGEVEHDFVRRWIEANEELQARGLDSPPYRSLWDWHGKWSAGELDTYRSRRAFVSDLFAPIIEGARSKSAKPYEPTGWARVDRTVSEMRKRLASAEAEEHYQTIGLLGRELLISAAREVFNADQHPTLDGVAASATDAKRMLEAYIAVALGGGANEYVRKHAKAALDLAVNLQHRRTATFREAAICVEATTSVVSVIAVITGLRDRKANG